MDDDDEAVFVQRPGRPPQLRLYPDGPLLVRGAVELVGPDGSVIEPRRRVVALCRCGRSALLPYCDGNHKRVASFAPDSDRRSRDAVPG
jgi:CDGSH-type Zn-finger protein